MPHAWEYSVSLPASKKLQPLLQPSDLHGRVPAVPFHSGAKVDQRGELALHLLGSHLWAPVVRAGGSVAHHLRSSVNRMHSDPVSDEKRVLLDVLALLVSEEKLLSEQSKISNTFTKKKASSI